MVGGRGAILTIIMLISCTLGFIVTFIAGTLLYFFLLNSLTTAKRKKIRRSLVLEMFLRYEVIVPQLSCIYASKAYMCFICYTVRIWMGLKTKL